MAKPLLKLEKTTSQSQTSKMANLMVRTVFNEHTSMFLIFRSGKSLIVIWTQDDAAGKVVGMSQNRPK